MSAEIGAKLSQVGTSIRCDRMQALALPRQSLLLGFLKVRASKYCYAQDSRMRSLSPLLLSLNSVMEVVPPEKFDERI
ncbi:MAG: hypothetical protein F6K36_05060 [Symploca sp. SIO3C6]|uniref:Uncharacterized protein n=1 Tax=Symploca sp. SIO1C4 TaxID=2607765 RepID=A0A6B3N5B3_9CYAN|nr:hypothetical protein [Symploca sp. SIO3C6]NER28906.1 hypothetical protein [Symploca sp. SIO1C4]